MEIIELALRREQAKHLAVSRAADICLNSDPGQWDRIAEAEIALVAPDVQPTFANQIKDSICLYREIRNKELERHR